MSMPRRIAPRPWLVKYVIAHFRKTNHTKSHTGATAQAAMRDRRDPRLLSAATASVGVRGPCGPTEAPTGGAQNTPFPGKHKGRAVPPEFTPSTGASVGAPAATQPPGKHKGQFERGFASPSPAQSGGTSNMREQGRQKGRGPEQTGTPPATGAAPYEGRGRGRAAEQTGTPPATSVAPEDPGGRQRGQGAYGQPGSAPGGGTPAGPERGQGKPEGGKKKGEKPSPSPAAPPPG